MWHPQGLIGGALDKIHNGDLCLVSRHALNS